LHRVQRIAADAELQFGWLLNRRIRRECVLVMPQGMILKELKEASDSNAPPWAQNEQVFILAQNEISVSDQSERKHIVVLRVTAIVHHVKVRIDALAITFNASD
jgi:hypothetical protein